jgi:hypothetical protein
MSEEDTSEVQGTLVCGGHLDRACYGVQGARKP